VSAAGRPILYGGARKTCGVVVNKDTQALADFK
jgi:hypothetical protein